MPSQDEVLQRIAAAAIPRKLGHLYSRYGQPAPVLGAERDPALVLGRSRGAAAAGLAGRPGSSQQEPSDEERAVLEREARDEEADQYADRDQGEGRYQDLEPDPDADESPQETAIDHSELGSAMESIWPNKADAPRKYQQVFDQSPDMGMEDFWRLYGHELESQHNVSRDDFFNAVDREP